MKPQTAVECLREAKALVARPENWAQGYFAYDDLGMPVRSTNKAAFKFCALGALERADGPAENEATDYLFEAIGSSIAHFNDSPDTTHEMLLAKFDEAITLAEKASGS